MNRILVQQNLRSALAYSILAASAFLGAFILTAIYVG